MRIVYGRNLCNSAMKYGLANEEIAGKQYEREYSTEVKMCGLFVDKDKPFCVLLRLDWLEAKRRVLERNYSKTRKVLFKCVLPEILDVRAPRNMPLKEPLYVEESSRSKKQKMIDIAFYDSGSSAGTSGIQTDDATPHRSQVQELMNCLTADLLYLLEQDTCKNCP
ncbi:hypothetical protein TNCV_1212021 [Trichonephila clavipes]|nr:hypothetical protein TNCV_1212021 [Trichonephila clavipes]